MKKNEEYIVDIIDNGYQGEGIAKIDETPVFIDTALKGEKVKIKILKVNKNFCYGKIIEIIEKATTRALEDCKTYKQCGGCNLRHINYKETLNIKKAIVDNCLHKQLIKNVKVNDVIGMNNPLYYRNKLQYPLGINADGIKVMGIYSSRTHNIIGTNECFIQNKKCQEIANDVFQYIRKNNITVYNENTGMGTVRHLIVRIGVNTDQVLLGVVVNDNNFKQKEELVNYITKKHPEIKTIILNYNRDNTNVILGKHNEIIFGSGYILDKLGKYTFKISLLSFYQVNPIQTEILYNTAIQYAVDETSKNDTALDLYCGIGTIGIYASKYFKKVYGIEIIEDAIMDAKENAKINNVDNIEFHAGDVEKLLPKIIKREEIRPEVVFVDPPRKGLDNNTIKTLINLQPEKIIYISCNPATLARDLKLLEDNYEIKEIQPVDMFPYTSHVECVVSMKHM